MMKLLVVFALVACAWAQEPLPSGLNCTSCIKLDRNNQKVWCPNLNAADITDGLCIPVTDFCARGAVQSISICETKFNEVPEIDPRPTTCLECVNIDANNKLAWCPSRQRCVSITSDCKQLIQSRTACAVFAPGQ